MNGGIINFVTKLHLVGCFYWVILQCTDPWILNTYFHKVPGVWSVSQSWHQKICEVMCVQIRVLEPQILHLVIYLVSLGLDHSSSLHWAVSCSPLTASTACLGKLQKEGRCCWNWTKLFATLNIGRTRMSGTAVLWFVYVTGKRTWIVIETV